MRSMDELDKEIQEMLDGKLSNKMDSEEAKDYKTLYEVLGTSPVKDYLPNSFADNVLKKVAVKPAKSSKDSFWWLGLMIFFMFLTGVIVMGLTMSALQVNAGRILMKYAPIILLGSVLIMGIQWVDRRLVRV